MSNFFWKKAAADAHWNTLGNWWTTAECNVQASSIPTAGSNVYLTGTTGPDTGPSSALTLARFDTSLLKCNWNCPGTTTVYLQEHGVLLMGETGDEHLIRWYGSTHKNGSWDFYGRSLNYGSVGDYANFHDGSVTCGDVADYATFDGHAGGEGFQGVWDQTWRPTSPPTIGDYATFNGTAHMFRCRVGDHSTWNDYSYDDGTYVGKFSTWNDQALFVSDNGDPETTYGYADDGWRWHSSTKREDQINTTPVGTKWGKSWQETKLETFIAAVQANLALDATVAKEDTVAKSATALDKTTWTDAKAGYLDAAVSEAGGGLTSQQVRDAMKLAPTAGAADEGSIDDQLAAMGADTITAELAAIRDKTDLIVAGAATVVSPVTDNLDVAIVQGDDYLTNNDRVLAWSNADGSWFAGDIAEATVVFIAKAIDGTVILTKEGSVVSATGTQEVQVELMAAESALFTRSGKQYHYQLLLVKDGLRQTEVSGYITVMLSLSPPESDDADSPA